MLDTEPEEAFDRLTTLAADLFDAPVALVTLIDAERQWFKSRLGVEVAQTPRGWAFCNHLIAMGPAATLVVEDATADPRFADNPMVTAQAGVRFYAGAALTTPEGHNIGSLCVIDRTARPAPSPRLMAQLASLAKIVVDELELRKAVRTLAAATAAAEEHARRAAVAEEVAGLGHWRYEPKSQTLTWSSVLFDIYGLPREGPVDLAIVQSMMHPDDVEARIGRVQRQIASGAADDGYVHRIIRPDGEVRFLQCRSVPEFAAGGDVGAVVGIAVDVTDQKRAEAEISDSEARYRLVTEASLDVVLSYDLNGRVSFASSAVRRFGYEPHQLEGRSGLELVHPDDAGRALARLATLLESTDALAPDDSREFRVRRADGSWVWVEGSPSVIRNDDGKPLAFINTLREISARKAMESALAASEARYRRLAEAAPDMISETGLDGKILFMSPASETILGHKPEDMVGRRGMSLVHPDDAAGIIATCQAILKSGGAFVPGPVQYRSAHADGGELWLESRPAAMRDHSTGEVIGFIDVIRDITVRKALETELENARQAAEHAAAIKGDFLANMSHELRTPLNAIIGFSGLLKQSSELCARDARQVGFIHDASQTLLGIVNDVLDFSKLDAGAFEFDAHPFDPRQLAESSVALLEGQAAAKGLRMAVLSTGRSGALLGDSSRLRQVLLNFISNAIKFTGGGRGVEVRVSQTVADDAYAQLRVEVQDSGIGVPAEQIEAIFDRFTQADASVSRNFGGTGLGLAICKHIIEALGGRIGVESAVGVGSTFWFEVTMPISDGEVGATDVGQEPVDAEHALRMLVVDDNAVNRELVSAILAPFDVEITTAADGVGAVELATRSAFDLILMDVQMPVMDGLTAARHIRASAGHQAQRTPIVAMTANVLPDQVARCLEAGMDDHLGKPINPAGLLEVLGRWAPARVAEDQNG